MNMPEHMDERDFAGTSLVTPQDRACSEMVRPSNPAWFEEHIRCLIAAGMAA